MADLLAAASLLLTVITILYSLWYPEISGALKLPIDEHPRNNEEAYRKCRALLIWKTIPLSIVALVLFLINGRDALCIVGHALAQLGATAVAPYSAVRTAFVVVVLVLAFLGGHTITAAIMLGNHVHKLNPRK
jgi:hypothetical protein